MTRIFPLLLFIGLARGQNPCEDELYQKLLASYMLSDEAWEVISEKNKKYFGKVNSECMNYKRTIEKELTSLTNQNPCEDPKYIALKEKGVDNLNDEEFDYFINILGNCKSDRQKVIEEKKKLYEIKRDQEGNEKWPSTKESFTLPDGTIDIASYSRWLKNGKKRNHKPKSGSQNNPNNPCTDKRYNKIKQKSFDQMSEREYNYFMLMEKQCSEQDTKSSVNKVKDFSPPKYETNNENNDLWYGIGKEFLNIIDDYQSDSYDIFNPNSYNSAPLCQYDDSRLKSTFETKIEGRNLRKFRKYQCSNIAETHYFWIRE